MLGQQLLFLTIIKTKNLSSIISHFLKKKLEAKDD